MHCAVRHGLTYVRIYVYKFTSVADHLCQGFSEDYPEYTSNNPTTGSKDLPFSLQQTKSYKEITLIRNI